MGRYTYKCVSCKEVKETSSSTSYICRPCLARRNAKKANQQAVKARTLRPYEALYRVLLRNAKAIKRPVKLSYEEFLKFTTFKFCHYCGDTLTWNKKSTKAAKGMVTNLDRKNSKVGYTSRNCVPCCGRCNRVKSNFFSHTEFLAVISLIRDMRGGSL